MNPSKLLRKMITVIIFLSPILQVLSSNTYASKFDNWKSGQRISNICDRAQKRQIKLYRTAAGLNGDGLTATVLKIAKKPVVCQGLDNITQFSYEKDLFEKPCAITLHFTPKNKQLKSIEVVWSEFSLKKLQSRSYDKEYVRKILTALSEKYGPPNYTKTGEKEDLFETYSCAWEIEKRNGKRDYIILDAQFDRIDLKYVDEHIASLTEKELKQIEMEKAQKEEIQEIQDMQVL